MSEETVAVADATQTVAPEVATVAKSVLTAYFDELAKTDGFAEIAPKLRALVLDEAVFAEGPIKAAMFSDMP